MKCTGWLFSHTLQSAVRLSVSFTADTVKGGGPGPTVRRERRQEVNDARSLNLSVSVSLRKIRSRPLDLCVGAGLWGDWYFVYLVWIVEHVITPLTQRSLKNRVPPTHHPRQRPIRRLCAAATGAKTHLHTYTHTPQATVSAYGSLWHTAGASICTNQRRCITLSCHWLMMGTVSLRTGQIFPRDWDYIFGL